jgi:hypothetical protein
MFPDLGHGDALYAAAVLMSQSLSSSQRSCLTRVSHCSPVSLYRPYAHFCFYLLLALSYCTSIRPGPTPLLVNFDILCGGPDVGKKGIQSVRTPGCCFNRYLVARRRTWRDVTELGVILHPRLIFFTWFSSYECPSCQSLSVGGL